jgi:hypothetical protein
MREANRIGRRVCDVITNGDGLDRSLELITVPLWSDPRVINTLSIRNRGPRVGPDGLS